MTQGRNDACCQSRRTSFLSLFSCFVHPQAVSSRHLPAFGIDSNDAGHSLCVCSVGTLLPPHIQRYFQGAGQRQLYQGCEWLVFFSTLSPIVCCLKLADSLDLSDTLRLDSASVFDISGVPEVLCIHKFCSFSAFCV